MQVKVKLLGVLRESGGLKSMSINIPDDATVESAIKQLIDGNEKLCSALWDKTVDSPIPNALIMIDGVEINNLRGVTTPLRADQELIILSVVHGG